LFELARKILSIKNNYIKREALKLCFISQDGFDKVAVLDSWIHGFILDLLLDSAVYASPLLFMLKKKSALRQRRNP